MSSALAAGAVAGVLSLVAIVAVAAAMDISRERAVRRPTAAASRAVELDNTPTLVARALAEADVRLPAAAVFRTWVGGLAVVSVVALVAAGPGLVLMAALTWSLAPVMAWWLTRHRATARLEAAVPLALDSIARSLRTGASLTQAVSEAAAEAGPLQRDLAEVAVAAERGGGVVDGLEAWARRRPAPSVRLAASALCLGAETGGAQARAVDGVAATIRLRLGVMAEARALAAQARSSALVIALAPLGFSVLAAMSDPRVAQVLTGSPLGVLLLACGLALDAAGAAWMARITRAAV